MERSFWIEPNIYPIVYFVSLGQTKEQMTFDFKRKFKNNDIVKKLDQIDENYMAYTQFFSHNNICIIAFKEQDPLCMHIAHEIFHATSKSMQRLGLRLCDKSEEAYAYLNGFLTDEFYKKYHTK